MQSPTILDFAARNEIESKPLPEFLIRAETKPRLDSLDSSAECSLQHLLELQRLIGIADHELDGYVFDDACLHAS